MTEIMYVAFIVICSLVFHYGISLFIRMVKRYSLGNQWVLALLYAARTPARVIIWLEAVLYSYQIVGQTYDFPVLSDRIPVHELAVVIPFVWFLFRLQSSYQRIANELNKRKQATFDPMLLSVLSKISTILIIAIAVLMLLNILGIPLQSLMVFGGGISIAVGFASQNVLGNFFGGLMVYANRPFKVGDWIKSPDKEVEGVVEEIGWYSTRIRTFERQILYVPNSLFTQIVLKNPSQMYNRRIRQTIGLRYQDIKKVGSVVDDIEAMLKGHPDIDQDQYLMVHWVNFGEYSLDIDVYAFTKTTDWITYRSVQQDVFEKIMEIVLKHGADVAFPTRDHRYPKE